MWKLLKLFFSEAFIKIDEKIKSDEVIKELFEIAGKNVPEQVIDRDEIRDELDELNEGLFDIRELTAHSLPSRRSTKSSFWFQWMSNVVRVSTANSWL